MKITGRWVTRSNNTLQSIPTSYYFWRGGSEVQTDSYASYGVSNIQSWTYQDALNNPGGLVKCNHNQTITNPRVNKIFETVMPNGIFNSRNDDVLYWDKPTTMEEVADNYIKFFGLYGTPNHAPIWGTRYADTDNRRDFKFFPAGFHNVSYFGGSGTKSYRWVVPQDGSDNFQVMYGNARKFSDVRFSTNAEHADNEYTIEFLVDHDENPWKSANTDAGEYFKYF